jgi:hypothetical protein
MNIYPEEHKRTDERMPVSCSGLHSLIFWVHCLPRWIFFFLELPEFLLPIRTSIVREVEELSTSVYQDGSKLSSSKTVGD